MKFFCEGSNLASATNIVSKALAVNKNIPILEGIKIKATSDNVTLSAYNQELYIEKTIPADVHEDGELVVNGKLFTDYCGKIAGMSSVEISREINNKLLIKVGKGSSEINFYEIQHFPDLGEYEDSISVTMKQKELKELLERAIFCVSMNDNRILLKSCNIEVKGEIIEAVCLDGFRVGISRKTPEEKEGVFKAIILGKIVGDILKVLTDSDDLVKMTAFKNMVVFDLGHTKIRTTTVEGDFYKYENNLPKTVRTSVVVEKSALEECLTRASIISRDSFYHTVNITIEDNTMNVLAESEKGRIDENIDCQSEGEPLKICLNNKFIQEAVSKIKEDYVKINFDGSTRPILVQKMEGDEFRCIILPVRVV